MKSNVFQKFGLTIAVAAIVCAGCKKDDNPVTPSFSTDIVSVAEGSSAMASIVAGAEPFKVQSSAEATVTVKVDGKTITVTGVAAGTASITVTGSDGGTAKLPVSVTQRAATAPKFSTSVVELDADQTAAVTVTDGTPAYEATSSKTEVATATVSGNVVTVRGVAAGTAIITVSGADKASAAFAVTVSDEQILFGPNKSQIGNGMKSFSIKNRIPSQQAFTPW
jgi:uncharacterized protein YjdB